MEERITLKSDKFLSKLVAFLGPSGETRTPGILLPNNLKRFFLVIYSAFPCFLVCFRYSLGIYKTAFHRCSGAVCGHLCGQKRFPPKTGDHSPAQDGKHFRVCVCRIVTLSRRLCKYFLQGAQLKVCGAINKEIGEFILLCHNNAGTQFRKS